MHKLSKRTIMLIAGLQILALLLLAGCNTILPTTVCHATGDPENPYLAISLDNSSLVREHLDHADDIYPVPVGGCPVAPVVIEDEQIVLCHATDDATKPYDTIMVSINGLDGHGDHVGDVIPVNGETCPNTLLPVDNNGKITICHATGSEKNPYNLITISISALSGHDGHDGDIIPAPAEGCPGGGK